MAASPSSAGVKAISARPRAGCPRRPEALGRRGHHRTSSSLSSLGECAGCRALCSASARTITAQMLPPRSESKLREALRFHQGSTNRCGAVFATVAGRDLPSPTSRQRPEPQPGPLLARARPSPCLRRATDPRARKPSTPSPTALATPVPSRPRPGAGGSSPPSAPRACPVAGHLGPLALRPHGPTHHRTAKRGVEVVRVMGRATGRGGGGRREQGSHVAISPNPTTRPPLVCPQRTSSPRPRSTVAPGSWPSSRVPSAWSWP